MTTQPQPVIVVSFSGGRTSGYMLKQLRDTYPDADLRAVFANTGKEEEATLRFVEACSINWGIPVTWLEAVVDPQKGKGTTYRVVDFKTASRNGEPFEAVIQKYGVPSVAFPHCSRELKIVPIQKWINDTVDGPYEMAIGIRYDEQDRIGDHWYPLIDEQVTKPMVRAWWRQQPFDLELEDFQGNCDLCFKKSINKLLTTIEQFPEKADWWDQMEQRYGNGYVMPRNSISYARLRELVKRGKFRRILNDADVATANPTLFDLGYACTCGVDYSPLPQ